MPGMGGSSVGNYTLGRPLVGGLVCGLILLIVVAGILSKLYKAASENPAETVKSV